MNNSPTPTGLATSFTASVTDGSHVTYSWDFGDGQSGSGAEVSYVYTNPGFYQARVTAQNDISSQTATTTVMIGEGGFIYLPVVIRP